MLTEAVIRNGFQTQHIEFWLTNRPTETNFYKPYKNASCQCFTFCSPGIYEVLINMDFHDNFYHIILICTVSNSFSPTVKPQRTDCEGWDFGIYTQDTAHYFTNNSMACWPLLIKAYKTVCCALFVSSARIFAFCRIYLNMNIKMLNSK